jgi:hypothetical protein
MTREEGRGALIGEFLESFFSAPAAIQDQIIFNAVKAYFAADKANLVDPFPVLSHLNQLMKSAKKS